jgi:hypothetical protein
MALSRVFLIFSSFLILREIAEEMMGIELRTQGFRTYPSLKRKRRADYSSLTLQARTRFSIAYQSGPRERPSLGTMATLKVNGALVELMPWLMVRTLPSPRPTSRVPVWLLDGQ